MKIWHDKWLLDLSHGRIISPPQHLAPDATVACLIDPILRKWRGNTIDAAFLPFEATTIRRIPLCSHPTQDSLVWMGTISGQFTVKSAYDFLWNEASSAPDMASTSSSTNMQKLWNGVWSHSVPAKIRNFGWRACNQILPTLTKLFQHKIVSSLTCYLCGEDEETTAHVLWGCPYAEKVWRSNPVFNVLPMGENLLFQDILQC